MPRPLWVNERMQQFGRLIVLLLLIGLLTATVLLVVNNRRPATSTPVSSPPLAGDEPAVLVGAGDIAECGTEGDEATAAVVASVIAEHPNATVFTAGDNAYDGGLPEEFSECYDPSWGQFKDRTRPAVGNHEFLDSRKAGGHSEYFGERAGEFDEYYYSYDLGGWHIVMLNSECHRVGCEPGSEDGNQAEWLQADLAASTASCTLAIWHHPRWSSGRYGINDEVRWFWDALYAEGAEVVVNGHEHLYERFEPLNPAGDVDAVRGMLQITAGTGGGNLRDFDEEDILATSVARGTDWGVLQLLLYPDRYEWEFLPVEGATFTDSGSGTCHD